MFLTHYASHEQEATYMYVEQSSFYLVYFKNKKLQFLNRFPYETIEDLLYFLLYSVEQLEVKTEKVPIYISGEITRNSLIYHGLRKYIRKCIFYENQCQTTITRYGPNLSSSAFFTNATILILCESSQAKTKANA
nr:DUF3822 family protein [Capnocytophaga canimorsus]